MTRKKRAGPLFPVIMTNIGSGFAPEPDDQAHRADRRVQHAVRCIDREESENTALHVACNGYRGVADAEDDKQHPGNRLIAAYYKRHGARGEVNYIVKRINFKNSEQRARHEETEQAGGDQDYSENPRERRN